MEGQTKWTYEELFYRNYGIFTEEEQRRIRDARIVIVGCGGIGGVIAVALARMGASHLVLMDPESYEPSNMNRQIACFCETIGKNKARCIAEQIHCINPEADVTVYERAMVYEEIEEIAKLGDVIVPVMDEWPLSLVALEIIRKSKPAVMAYPVGALGRVSVFTADSPTVAECLVMPYGFGYKELQEYTTRPDARRLLLYYVTEGQWREDWFEQWVENKVPHAQICPIVWITGTLAALEVIKLVSGKWKPIIAPYYWYITPWNARIRKFGLGRKLASRLSRHPWLWERMIRLSRSRTIVQWFTRLID
ncbi:MAG: HesA/MoeB/ThiF family protein [Anaerolineae bacterium]